MGTENANTEGGVNARRPRSRRERGLRWKEWGRPRRRSDQRSNADEDAGADGGTHPDENAGADADEDAGIHPNENARADTGTYPDAETSNLRTGRQRHRRTSGR